MDLICSGCPGTRGKLVDKGRGKAMTILNNENKSRFLLLGGILLASLIAVAYHLWLRSLPQRYTVGEIYEVKSAAKGDPHARFRYSIDGITYTNTVGIETRNRRLLIGKCYVISVPVGHEGSGSLLWEHSVPPGKIAPPEGWKKLPSFD